MQYDSNVILFFNNNDNRVHTNIITHMLSICVTNVAHIFKQYCPCNKKTNIDQYHYTN